MTELKTVIEENASLIRELKYNVKEKRGVIEMLAEQLSREAEKVCELVEACKAIVRDFEDVKDPLTIPASSCVHVPNHTDLCPYWLAKQALAKVEAK